MIHAVECVEWREESEYGTEVRRLELPSRDQVHRAGRGGCRVRADANEAEDDVHRQPNRARSLWLEEWMHARDIARHGNERGNRCGNQSEADFARQTLDDYERDRQHQAGEGKTR